MVTYLVTFGHHFVPLARASRGPRPMRHPTSLPFPIFHLPFAYPARIVTPSGRSTVCVPRMIFRGESKDLSSSAGLRAPFSNFDSPFSDLGAKSFLCHTSTISPVTPVFATDPKTLSCNSFVCHTCHTPPGHRVPRIRTPQKPQLSCLHFPCAGNKASPGEAQRFAPFLPALYHNVALRYPSVPQFGRNP